MKNAKRILIPALAFILTLSLSLGCFAAVTIDYTFTAEINGEEYTFLFGRADTADAYDEIGVTVNGTEYKVDEDKIDQVKATGRFGMAFKDDSNVLASVTPYVKNEGEKIEGVEFDVDKTVTLPDVVIKETTPVIEFLDTDDRALTTGNELKQGRLWTDGVTVGYNWLSFLKIDISAIKDKIDLTRDIKISLYGAMQSTKDTKASYMAVKSFMMPDSFDWEAEKAVRVDGTKYNFSKQNGMSEGEDYEAYANNKTPISTTLLEFDNGSYDWVDINITPAIYEAVKNNENYAYVILAPDHRNVNNTCNAIFRFYLESSEKYQYAPKLKYSEFDAEPSNTAISEASIGTEKITKADFVDGTYTYFLRAGEAYPSVTAVAETEGAQVTVTQASVDASYASINVVSKNGKNNETYTVNFVKPETVQFFDGLIINGYSNLLSGSDKENLTDNYYYNNEQTDSKRKSNGQGVVANTSDDRIQIGSSGYCYNAPMLLQLDLTKLENIDTSKPVTMNLYYSRDDATANKVGVELYNIPSENINWSALTTETLKTTIYTDYIKDKTPVTTKELFINGAYTEGKFAESGLNGTYNPGCHYIDITAFVKNCLDNNITNPVVAVYLDGKGFMRFNYNTSTTSFVSYYEDTSYLFNIEISEATVGTEKLTKADFVDGAYNYYVKAGEAYPEVTAIAEIEGATVTVTQASPDANYATINVVSENGVNSATYTIKFVEFNYNETISPAISYFGSDSTCVQKNGDDFRFLTTIFTTTTVNFLKIDISDFKNKDYIDENSKFALNIRAKMQTSLYDTGVAGLDAMTVNAVALPDTFDWDVEAENRATGSTYTGEGEGSDYNTYFAGKTPVATTKLPYLNAEGKNDFIIISLDITSVIYNAIQGEGNYAYIALAGNPDELDVNKNVKSVTFYYNATANSYRTAPSITLDAYKIGE